MLGDGALIAIVGVVLTLAVALPFYVRQLRAERKTDEAEVTALRHGLHEPASLHPVIDVESCIGTGNCLEACPEHDVLGLRSGQAVPISPARCVGHGLCERACPTDAIRLVFGTARRGVEIPRVKANFETNVPGIYIVGELGGMGLIQNAFEQARQCVLGITREPKRGLRQALDAVVVGCGPAGLAASVHCLEHGLAFVTIEKEDVGGTVRTYPRKKLVMTRPITVPGYGKLRFREILKEELIDIWEDVVTKTGLSVNTSETVSGIERVPPGAFLVKTDRGAYRTKRVILAIGRRGVPRKLNVPGEGLPKVVYSLREPEAYRGDRALVVGGGDSAVEAALALAEQRGTEVAIAYRGDRFSRIKPANLERLERTVGHGQLDVHWSTEVVEIAPKSVKLRDRSKAVRDVPNDVVAIFAGGELPTKFLEQCGVAVEVKFGTPIVA